MHWPALWLHCIHWQQETKTHTHMLFFLSVIVLVIIDNWRKWMAENNYRQTRLQQLGLGISADPVSALFLHSLQNPTKTLLFSSQSTVKSLFYLFICFYWQWLYSLLQQSLPPILLNSVIWYLYKVLVLNSLCPLLFWAKVSFSLRTHPGMLLSNIFGIFLLSAAQTWAVKIFTFHWTWNSHIQVSISTKWSLAFVQQQKTGLGSRSEVGGQRLRMTDSWFTVQLPRRELGIVNNVLDENEECTITWNRLKGPKVTPFFKGFYPWLMCWEV